ncbi:MAG: hypothetical protein ACRDGB_15455 [Candidatus Limnocylindria bacterium]
MPLPTTEFDGRALDVALMESFLSPLLEQYPYRIEAIVRQSRSVADVYIRFNDWIATEEWDDAVCGIVPARFDGIVWRVNLEEGTWITVSPRWGNASCTTSL